MSEENRLRFVEAMRELDGPVMIELLPRLTLADLNVVRQYWLGGHLGELDPTNVLCAGDYADQFLSLPEHAVALYDAALEFMDKYPNSVTEDTDCAAASLNLIDLLVRSGKGQVAAAAARRAGRMPVKRAVQNVQLALWIGEAGDAKTAYALFQRGKADGLSSIAAEMGLTVADLNQTERALARAAGAG
jgi:hypothetical protein